MRHPIYFILWIVLLHVGSVSGIPSALAASAPMDSAEESLSVFDCVRRAESSDPVALSVRAQRLGAQAVVEQARALPNPSVSYLAQDLGLQGSTGPLLLQQVTAGFSPFAALLRVQESRAACASQRQTQAAIAVDLLRLRETVGRAFYELQLLEKLWRLEQDSVRLSEQLVAESQTRKRHGDASGLDVLRAESEREESARLAEHSAHTLAMAQRAFALLIGESSPKPLLLAQEDPSWLTQLPIPIADALSQVQKDDVSAQCAVLLELALSKRPERAWALEELHQSEVLSTLATLRALPLSDIQVSGGIRSSMAGVGGIVAITGSLPILDWNQGLRHRAQAQGVRAQARLAEVRQQIQIEVESSLRDFYHVRALRLQRAQPLHERRARALDLTRKLFAEGLASFGDVVMASRDLFSARRTLLQLERDALVARWRLAVAVAPW